MLCELTIENVAVIEHAELRLGNGFNVLTGETGAGKSIIIDSIGAILGGRTSRDIVRTGAEKAAVWARFCDISKETQHRVQEAGYPCEEGELLLFREIGADGRSSCRINGKPASASTLREIGEGLVAIHGQNDGRDLLDAATHLAVLDNFAQNAPLRGEYETAYKNWQRLLKRQKELLDNTGEKERRMDMLRFQIGEIEQAHLQQGEEEQLLALRSRLRNKEKIHDALRTAAGALAGEEDSDYPGAAAALSDAARALQTLESVDPQFKALAEQLQDAYYTVDDIGREVERQLTDMEQEPFSLDEIEDRLALLSRLQKKYGTSVDEILTFAENARLQLGDIGFSEEELQKLEKEIAATKKQVSALAEKLTQSRTSAFDILQQRIKATLQDLQMSGALFGLAAKTVAPQQDGHDQMEFLLSTNKGESLRPLIKAASGGELSRIVLAVKNALADRDALPTVVYDEIDTGISGNVAIKLGALLRRTAKGRQILCVTHSGAVAAFGHAHYRIEKETKEERTFTHVEPLAGKARVEEIARIQRGSQLSAAALKNAEELLRQAQKD